MTNQPSLPAAFAAGNLAVVTGAASGIGFAAASRFATLGMKVALADRDGEALERATREVAAASTQGPAAVIGVGIDVSRQDEFTRLRATVTERFGPVSVLMNNAGVGNNPGPPWENSAAWRALVDVNLWGVVYGCEAFVPEMLARNEPGLVINTGSKQGITSPPGNAAYNLSKAALRNFTESLAHALRGAANGRISAHLLIPGFTHTGMTGAAEKPASAWTPSQVVDFMLERLSAGDFYVLCPDNAVDRATDERRMRWAMDDIILNRPALSRWHPDFEAEFARYMSTK